jgi:hypothetical protein
LICVSADGATCNVNNLTGLSNGGTSEEIGGTSVATPEMAGVMALINQKSGSAQGSPNAGLYQLAGKQTPSNCSAETGSTSNGCYFNDVDQGTNSMPCAVSTSTIEGGAAYNSNTGSFVAGTTYSALASPNCTAVNSGDVVGTLVSSGTTQGYAAGSAFDLATGLGSLNVANVVNGWPVVTLTGSKTATVSVTPASTTPESDLSLNVTIAVNGSSGTPSGSVSLYAGSYAANATLSAGGASFTIPAGSFTSGGSQKITVNYSGDSTYGAATNTAAVTVNYVNFTLGAITSPSAISRGTSTTATAKISSSNGYKGTVTVACTLTSEPSGAIDAPTCTPGSTATLTASTTSSNVTLNITTTAASAAVSYPKLGDGKGWLGAGGGSILALLIFCGIPAKRRSWRSMVGLMVLMVALGTLSACSSGGSSSSGGGTTTSNPGTTSGTYTYTVTVTGNQTTASVSPQVFNVIIN